LIGDYNYIFFIITIYLLINEILRIMKKVIRLTEKQLEDIVRRVISENEVNEQLEVKWGKPIKIFSKKTQGKETLSSDDYTGEANPEDMTYIKSNEGPMLKLMSNSSKRKWEEVKEEKPAFALAAVKEFTETNPEDKWNNIYVKKGPQTKETIPVEGDKHPIIPFIFPAVASPNASYFQDNYYAPTEMFRETFNKDVYNPLKQQSAQLVQPTDGKPKMALTSLSIVTSCSTLPNGKSPDGKTYSFKELSQLRNNSAKTYIIEKLQELGVDTSNAVITQEYLGDNGDGTSGPKWTGKDSDRAKYDQYKVLDVDIEIAFNQNANPETTEPTTQVVTDREYSIRFTRKTGFDFAIRLPVFRWHKKRRTRRQPKRRARMDKCASF
jgi:hypothetical protein